MLGFFIIPIVFMLIGMVVSSRLKSRMAKYSQMQLRSGLSGREVAEKMLRDHGIHDVEIVSTGGFLTDHYNPMKKTVNLSEGVYNARSVAAAAVAAHEVGHAVQHAAAYTPVMWRSALVPLAKMGGWIANIAIMVGLYMLSSNPTILWIGVIGYAATTLFSVVTLPVEFDATRRGLKWLTNAGITYGEEHEAAKDGLRWAALTYVVAALASIAQLLWLILLASRD
ncbi:MAG: zinc metallopeptidase [Bacteroidota bacterium]